MARHRVRGPLIMHVVHRLSVGGLENGVINLINHMPRERYRHAIVCLTDFTEFRQRIRRPDVRVIALRKREGQDVGIYRRMLQVLRSFRPDVVHTRNLSALEHLILAAMSGVAVRIHGEHGRDVYELDGRNVKYNLLRRLTSPWVHRFIAVSSDLANWLIHTVGIRHEQVLRIYNGVDTQRFYPRVGPRAPVWPESFAPAGTFVVGTVGRLQVVKDQLTLVRAFIHLVHTEPTMSKSLRLAIIGDGPLRKDSMKLLESADVSHLAWLPGERSDVPEIVRNFDLFVLPSLREGISNTVLEAMASGLPVVATGVGGNPELVDEGHTGLLVPPADPVGMAEAIRSYCFNREIASRHGQAGRERVEKLFSMEAMTKAYLSVYDDALNGGNHNR